MQSLDFAECDGVFVAKPLHLGCQLAEFALKLGVVRLDDCTRSVVFEPQTVEPVDLGAGLTNLALQLFVSIVRLATLCIRLGDPSAQALGFRLESRQLLGLLCAGILQRFERCVPGRCLLLGLQQLLVLGGDPIALGPQLVFQGSDRDVLRVELLLVGRELFALRPKLFFLCSDHVVLCFELLLLCGAVIAMGLKLLFQRSDDFVASFELLRVRGDLRLQTGDVRAPRVQLLA